MHDLSKKDKKICRELMSQAIEKEFEAGLKESEAIILEWKTNIFSGRLAFHKLRDHVNDFRKHLARRYDDLSGSDYLPVVAAIFGDGYLTIDDMKNLSDDAKNQIKLWKKNALYNEQ